MEMLVTTGAIRLPKLIKIVTTNKPSSNFFQVYLGRVPNGA